MTAALRRVNCAMAGSVPRGLIVATIAVLLLASVRVAQISSSSAGIYAADRGTFPQVIRMDDMSAAGWTAFGTLGSEANQFRSPRSIFVDASGRIYVADYGNQRIVRMDDMTGAVDNIGYSRQRDQSV